MKELNQPVRVVLASTSKFFLEGIQKILENDEDIEIVAQASNLEGIRELLGQRKPDFLFLDNRTLKLDTDWILNSINKRQNITLVLFADYIDRSDSSLNIIYITKKSGSSELIESIKRKSMRKDLQANSAKDKSYHLTNIESKITQLVTSGYTNREILRSLSISEKTVKAHPPHIFTKLEIDDRYQLTVHARQNILNTFPETKIAKDSYNKI